MPFDVGRRILENVSRVIVGKAQVVELLLAALVAEGHALVEDLPGLGKTLLAKSLARSVGATFKRVQFTPDLLPADITGFTVYRQQAGEFVFQPGPVMTHVLLADEINRTIPRTQASLLESMEERQVTVDGRTYPLPRPFFVLATQNPIEQEGTYPLPEAQLDRFMFLVKVGYPSDDEESEIVRRMTSPATFKAEAVLQREQILAFQQLVRRVPAADAMIEYAKRLVRKTRVTEADTPDFISKWVTWGAGPRASMNLILAAKARAILHGEAHVSWDDVRAVAKPVLRHRIILNFAAQAERISTDDIIEQLVAHVGEKE